MESVFPLSVCVIVSIISILFVGFSKAGFGGGVGLLATPLLSLVFSPKFAVGFMLPLLVLADIITVTTYRGHWHSRNLRSLLPGAAIGIIAGSIFVGSVSDELLKRAIGFIVLTFLAIQWLRGRLDQSDDALIPKWWHGSLIGAIAGTVSAISHSAGVIVAMYLIPQHLPKRTFVSTMVTFFGLVNAAKLIPYISMGLINSATLKYGVFFIPVVPVGAAFGFWLNRRVSQKTFTKIIYALVLITGIQLLSGLNMFKWMFSR